MAILAFDIGGTSVKFGIWEKDRLVKKGNFRTPKTWNNMKREFLEIKDKLAIDYPIEGVAISSPGAVNQKEKVIEGVSAVPFLHQFPIYDELEEIFEAPVAIENDANSAALAEVWKGAAKGLQNVLFIVIGTGIGGSVIVNGEVQHGKHLFGGEFGFTLINGTKTFSELGTAVGMAKRYNKQKGTTLTGEEVFKQAEAGDEIAQKEVDTFYNSLAIGIYNLQYSFDPELILLGGGVSNKPDLLDQLDGYLEKIIKKVKIAPFKPEVALCQYRNDANLIGAVYNFFQQKGEKVDETKEK
ncbi:ROK family protein [Lacticigenium naphthae]|uniref:ROK family protein n=1 Tax=Lacticigenium naphthae TaxID=515351 RepID=UPI0003FCAF0D|nr:ROK family protein [Lacticigenium naphthae]